jgi:hypothetical protein
MAHPCRPAPTTKVSTCSAGMLSTFRPSTTARSYKPGRNYRRAPARPQIPEIAKRLSAPLLRLTGLRLMGRQQQIP